MVGCNQRIFKVHVTPLIASGKRVTRRTCQFTLPRCDRSRLRCSLICRFYCDHTFASHPFIPCPLCSELTFASHDQCNIPTNSKCWAHISHCGDISIRFFHVDDFSINPQLCTFRSFLLMNADLVLCVGSMWSIKKADELLVAKRWSDAIDMYEKCIAVGLVISDEQKSDVYFSLGSACHDLYETAVASGAGGSGGGVDSSQALIEHLLAEQNSAADGKVCVVCLSAPKSICFAPCGHICCCDECSDSKKIKSCPLCRAHITRRQKAVVT